MKLVKKYLTPNQWSRPGKESDMKPIKAVVLHWTASPRGTAEGVYNWFEARKNGKHSYGSTQYCVDLNGDVWQYIPDEEMAYHVGSKTYTDYALNELSSYPNNCTLGIEMCHMSWEGEYTQETWEQTQNLTALLLMEHGLKDKDITTHKAIVGWKECPMWFHKFPEELDRFKKETKAKMKKGFRGKVHAMWGLNVRDGVMGNKIGKLKDKQEVKILGIRNLWYKVEIPNGQIGYASGSYIELI